eukprot:7425406-Pyramimonas_sp.AAC.1
MRLKEFGFLGADLGNSVPSLFRPASRWLSDILEYGLSYDAARVGDAGVPQAMVETRWPPRCSDALVEPSRVSSGALTVRGAIRPAHAGPGLIRFECSPPMSNSHSEITHVLRHVRPHGWWDSSRASTVGRWLHDPRTLPRLGILFITTQVMSKFEYNFMRPGDDMMLPEFLDRFESPMKICLCSLARLLKTWHFRGDSPWNLMGLLGVFNVGEPMRRFARRQVLLFSAGMAHHCDMKYSSLEFRLQRLTSDQWSADEKAEVRKAFCDALPCCLSLFGRGLKARFPREHQLESGVADIAIYNWVVSKGFT